MKPTLTLYAGDRRKGPPRGPAARAYAPPAISRVSLAVAAVGEGAQPLDVMNACKLDQSEQREFLRRVELMRRMTI